MIYLSERQTLLSAVFLLIAILPLTLACNELVCGPIVTKCQLLKHCNSNCEVAKNKSSKDCPCCRTCAACLEDKYPSCCSCVGMCEPPEISRSVNSSSVEDLRDPIPGLFSALTATEEVTNDMWSVVKYPAYQGLLQHKNFEVSVDKVNGMVKFSWDDEVLSTVKMENCSVAFVKDCLSLEKCKHTCRSMGAARFRWFHNKGCCECVGDKCIDYGKNQAMCERCVDDGVVEEESQVEFDDEL